MSMTSEAMARVDQRDDTFRNHLETIVAEPHTLVATSLASMINVRDGHMKKRAVLEADHRTAIDQCNAHYNGLKQALNVSVQELERQLGQLRDQWAKVCDEQTGDLQRERQRWEDQDAAMAKLLKSEDLMIAELKST